MGQPLIPALQISIAATVRRVRELPVAGAICCRVGESVRGDQCVAKAELAGDLTIVRIAELMGIGAEEVIAGIKVKVGDPISADQEICTHAGIFGWFKSVQRSPVAGVVEFISEQTGHIGVRGAPRTIDLLGYIDGKVVEVSAGKSVAIEAEGALVQGIFGVGGERRGTIRALNIGAHEPVTERLLAQRTDLAGAVIVGGTAPDGAALRAAAEAGAVGMIVGSIDDQALSEYLGYDLGIALTGDEQIPMTVIVTEGFGNLPIALRVQNLLRELDGRSAAINGATQVRAGAVRPEIIVPYQVSGTDCRVDQIRPALELGARVRLIRTPYFGVFGRVVELPKEPQRIATGAVTRVARIQLDSGGEIITAPRANIELT